MVYSKCEVVYDLFMSFESQTLCYKQISSHDKSSSWRHYTAFIDENRMIGSLIQTVGYSPAWKIHPGVMDSACFAIRTVMKSRCRWFHVREGPVCRKWCDRLSRTTRTVIDSRSHFEMIGRISLELTTHRTGFIAEKYDSSTENVHTEHFHIQKHSFRGRTTYPWQT